MSKFCANCGAQQPDEANVCGNCGSAMASENAVNNTDVVSTLKSKAPILVAAVAVLLVVIILIVALSGGGYKSAVKNMIDVQFKGKANKIEKLAPEEYWQYLEDEADFDMDDHIEDYEESWEDRQDYYEDEFGKNFKVKYKITDKDELSDKKLDELADSLNENYEIKRKDVKKAYKLDVELTIKGSEDEDDGELEDLLVVKIGGDWYICSESGTFPYAY